MKYLERKRKLEYLIYFMKQRRCFSVNQIAEKFKCSRRTADRMISDLKDEGYDIKYSKILMKFIVKS